MMTIYGSLASVGVEWIRFGGCRQCGLRLGNTKFSVEKTGNGIKKESQTHFIDYQIVAEIIIPDRSLES